MSGIVDEKLGVGAIGADTKTKHNSLIDALLTAFDIVAGVITGTVTFDSPPVIPLLGSPVSRTIDTVYQATTDCIITACVYFASGGSLGGYTDANNPPTTRLVQPSVPSSEYASLTFPVKKGNYWKVAKSVSCSDIKIYETPIGA